MKRKWLFALFLSWFFFGPLPFSWAAGATSFSRPVSPLVLGICQYGDNWLERCAHGTIKRHTGSDIDVNHAQINQGIAVKACANGTVVYAGSFGQGWGNCVIVEHASPGIGKWTSKYGHILIAEGIEVGRPVDKGDNLGRIDPRVSPPHLHFDIRLKAYDTFSIRGALPQCKSSESDPKFPEKFVDPYDFLDHPEKYGFKPEDKPLTFLADKVAAAIVLDKSGSMKWNDKFQHACQGIDSLIDTFKSYDLVSLAWFGEQGESLAPLSHLASPNQRKALKSRKRQIGEDEWTNLGGGLTVAYSHLAQAPKGFRRVAILLSDGVANKGDLWGVVDKFTKSGIPIYTIAYGKDADRKVLATIAQETGGCTLNADIYTISQAYQKLATYSRLGSVVTSYNDTIEQGKTLQYFVDIAKDFTTALFHTDWFGSSIELSLVSPSGTQIRADNLPANARLVREPTYSLIEINDPEPGKWQVKLYGAQIPTKEQVNLTVSGESPLMFNSLATGWYFDPGSNVLISVKLAEIAGGKACNLPQVSVTARLHKPDPKPIVREGNSLSLNLGGLLEHALDKGTKLTLYDDGQHWDGEANDGIYAGIYENAIDQGAYAVEIRCSAALSTGARIERSLSYSFQVGDINANKVTLADFLGSQ